MDSLSAPKNDELNNRNINESSPEAAAQVSPQESKNQPSIPTNEDNKEANDVKEEEPTEMKSNGNKYIEFICVLYQCKKYNSWYDV